MRSSVNVSSIVLIITHTTARCALFPLLFGGRCGDAVTGQLNGVRLRQFPGVSSPIRKLCGCWRKIGNLDTFPIKDGSSKIMEITRGGVLSTMYINFTTVLGLAFDSKGRLYVLENTTGNPSPTPGTGKILRVDGKYATT
jgi:hypothetical protein